MQVLDFIKKLENKIEKALFANFPKMQITKASIKEVVF
jgi:hypothetical protein